MVVAANGSHRPASYGRKSATARSLSRDALPRGRHADRGVERRTSSKRHVRACSRAEGGFSRLSSLLRLRPLNLEKAKHDFMNSGCLKAPRFEYAGDVADLTREILDNRNVSFKLMAEAEQIMSDAVLRYGGLSAFRTHLYGSTTCSSEEVQREAVAYLDKHCTGIHGLIEVVIQDNLLSCANVTKPSSDKYRLNLSRARAHRGMVRSMLDHEIGTHFLRMINDERQPWHKQRARYGLADSCAVETIEEGLAALNTCLSLQCKVLFEYALRYYSVCYGARFGFVELYAELRKWDVDPDTCWQLCCRTKRGLSDTASPGAFWRDQSYFQGIVDVLQYFVHADLDHRKTYATLRYLYSGRLTLSDIDCIRPFAKKKCIVMPHFLRTPTDVEAWVRHCQDIVQQNRLFRLQVTSGDAVQRSLSAPAVNPSVPRNRCEVTSHSSVQHRDFISLDGDSIGASPDHSEVLGMQASSSDLPLRVEVVVDASSSGIRFEAGRAEKQEPEKVTVERWWKVCCICRRRRGSPPSRSSQTE
eukprot:TRINITY_DN31399_c0_g1_i1.p1 TRINITY_DN31399_c0_g1~~TRINITY_DN31399_c0_g1_i1.p1  ORF type:complete len:530 (-),score=9.28 TRINITY_DN31399_c0_g1_i1:204-1793(-)